MIKITRLQVEMFGVSQILNAEIVDAVGLDYLAKDSFVMRVTTKFATTGVKVVEQLVPANSFEHFKKDYFPKFLLKKFPVKYATLKFECREIFPEYSHLATDGRRYVEVAHLEPFKLDPAV